MKHIVIDARIRKASTGKYVDKLLEYLQKLDNSNKYTVLLASGDKWKPVNKNFTSKLCEYPQFSFNLFHQFGFAWQLYRLRADLVFFPMNQQPLFYFKKVITATMDLTMLRFTRPGKHSRFYHNIRMLAYRFLFWFSLKKSKHIITISEYVKSDLQKNYPFTKNKITVTYCASEPAINKNPVQLKNINELFIFHVGSPFPHKNISRLINAYEKLKKQYPNLQLVLAGKKEYYFEKLAKEISLSPNKNAIILPDYVSEGELRWLYENAECYVLPSLSEGFGLPGLEAMAHGTPLVSSNATCLPEIYGDGAHYFDPNSVDDMAAKIGEVLGDKKLRDRLIKNGYSQLKKYSWEKMAKETLAVYNEVL